MSITDHSISRYQNKVHSSEHARAFFNGVSLMGAIISLHGHAFDVVQSIQGPANFVNPPRRDVVGVGGELGDWNILEMDGTIH
jgi:hypothetical protein